MVAIKLFATGEGRGTLIVLLKVKKHRKLRREDSTIFSKVHIPLADWPLRKGGLLIPCLRRKDQHAKLKKTGVKTWSDRCRCRCNEQTGTGTRPSENDGYVVTFNLGSIAYLYETPCLRSSGCCVFVLT